jgi:CTP:molybdopterin cytidylyltransferase MocA
MVTWARRRVAALRQPGPSARLARALWIAWAVVVWNVVFDRVIVVAGRQYITAAARAAAADPAAPPLNMDDWMKPAVRRGLVAATAAAGVIVVTGLAATRIKKEH